MTLDFFQYSELILSLFFSAILGSLIGLEREIDGQPAGLRTHMILCVGAALAAILSILYSRHLSNPEFPSDPARIVAQVVSGIGFLGAGAILRLGITIKGLTTAGSLWTTAIIGISCGSGYYELAISATILVILILSIINKVEKFFLVTYKTHTVGIVLKDRPGIIKSIKKTLEENKIKLMSLDASMPNKDTLELSMIIRKPHDLSMDKVIYMINEIEETQSMKIN